MTEPSTEDLIKAIFELSTLVGVMPSRIEREEIQAATNMLITPWLLKNLKPEELSQWLNQPGIVKAASEAGYEEHLRHKYNGAK